MTDRLACVVDVARGSERGRWEAYAALMHACGKPEARPKVAQLVD